MVTTNFADRLIEGDPSAQLIQDIFCPGIGLARVQCAACGSIRGVGSLSLHPAPAGAVLQCPGCDDVVMRVLRTPVVRAST